MSDERPKKPGGTRAPWEGEAESPAKTLITPTPIPRDIVDSAAARSSSTAKKADSRHGVGFPTEPSGGAGAVGRIIDGRFRLESTLGEGGMGVVYRAVQLSVQRPVALKLLKNEASRDSKMAQRFTREAESISRLAHPNIVTLLDFGHSADGQLYLAMEFVEGERLTDRIAAPTRLTPKEAVAIVIQILAALEHAHGRGIVHRDLKPSNVMLVDVDGHHNFVKLLDFGVAKLYDELQSGVLLTGSGMVVGTPAYMAPEQALGERVDGRADVYSAGLLLYEMLAGARPFPDDSTRNTFLAQINQPPPPFDPALRSVVPSGVYNAMMKALEKRPENRFQSAIEMRRELVGESGLATTASRARPVTGSGATRAMSASGSRETLHARGEVVVSGKRRWIWAGGLGIGAAAAAVVAILALPERGRPGDSVVAEARRERGAVEGGQEKSNHGGTPEKDREPGAKHGDELRESSWRRGSAAQIRRSEEKRSSGKTEDGRADAGAVGGARASAAVPVREARRAVTRSSVRVRLLCGPEQKPCWANVSLDEGPPNTKLFPTFDTVPGSHKITVEKDGFKSVKLPVRVLKARQTVSITLEPVR